MGLLYGPTDARHGISVRHCVATADRCQNDVLAARVDAGIETWSEAYRPMPIRRLF